MRPRVDGKLDLFDDSRDDDYGNSKIADASEYITDIREYDVPYHTRVMIDMGEQDLYWLGIWEGD